jgi:hypothetical protein
LLAAANEVNVYMADAVEASDISETATELVFSAPKGYRMYFSDPSFPDVLKLAGELRTVRFAWKEAA